MIASSNGARPDPEALLRLPGPLLGRLRHAATEARYDAVDHASVRNALGDEARSALGEIGVPDDALVSGLLVQAED